MKSCPKCYSKQDDSVVICDCGYNFEVEKDINTKRLEYDNEKDEYTFKRKFHPVLFIVFIMLILMGFSMIISGLVFTNLYSVGPFFLLVLGSVLIIYGLIFLEAIS